MISNKEDKMKRMWNMMGLVFFLGMMLLAMDSLAASAGAQGVKAKESMFSLIMKGGPVMIPLGLASVLALALAIERSLSLSRNRIIPPGFMDSFKTIMSEDPSGKKAIQFCEEHRGPVGNIFKSGLQKLGKGDEALEKAVEDAGFRETDKMKRSLRGLSIIVTVAPLLGLLGTVYGMISAFETASSAGVGKADVLAKGIYEALVTTAAGLTIAIPVLLVFQFLNNRVDTIIDKLDEMGIDFMTHCTEKTESQGKE